MRPQPVPVIALGPAAAEVLTRDRTGSVIAVFRRSFYVCFGDGDLVCVGGLRMGESPFDAACALSGDPGWTGRGIDVGAGAAVNAGDSILNAGRLRLSFGAARIRRPPSGPLPLDGRRLAIGLDRLASAARRNPCPGGFAPLIPDLCHGQVKMPAAGDRELLARTARSMTPLVEWLRRPGPTPPDVSGLIGLGPGLTPSGDDFLSGTMMALRAFGRVDAAEALAGAVLPAAAGQTGDISLAYLRCAARGMVARSLTDAISHLAAGEADMDGDLVALDRIGHSSGRDGLAGAVAVCSSLS